MVINCEYESIDFYGFVKKNGKKGYFKDFQFVFPPIYDELYLNGLPSKLNKKYGLISDGSFRGENGEVIPKGNIGLDFDYNQIIFAEVDADDSVVFKGPIQYYLFRKGNMHGGYQKDYGVYIKPLRYMECIEHKRHDRIVSKIKKETLRRIEEMVGHRIISLMEEKYFAREVETSMYLRGLNHTMMDVMNFSNVPKS